MALTTQAQVTASALAVAGFANQIKAAKVIAEEYSLFNASPILAGVV